MSTKENIMRRSGAKIMASLILLLGSLSYIMVLAIINGSMGFFCAMGVRICGNALYAAYDSVFVFVLQCVL